MATVVPPGQGQPPLPRGDNSPPPLSWEGEKMFNIYIYDYCSKRGFKQTAHELMIEAEIPPDSTPPINARQGLLFEWWSVFWVLFTAKANGNGSEEAMLYTQHQAHQLSQRQASQRLPAPSQAPLPLGQPTQPPMPHQPPVARLNGMPRSGPGFMNGPMPNGVGPNPLSQGPMQPQPGAPTSFPMGGPGPHQNGIPGPPGPSQSSGVLSAQSQNYQSLLPGQRPPPPQQQRGPNGSFQSPTMAHSPQNPAVSHGQQQPMQQQSQLPQQLSQPPMGQLGGPSPHLPHSNMRGMLPPNGPQGMNTMNPGQQQPQGQGNPSTPSYQQLGRPPSRTATPGQGGMMHPSPSLTARQPPGNMNDGVLNSELMRIPQPVLVSLKQEIGLADKDLLSLMLPDKQRILNMYRQRSRKASEAVAGPSNPMMQPPNQQQRNQQQNQQQQQQQRVKRNSTSPGEEHENLPRNESSPPDRKRIRRSPMEQPTMPPIPYPHPQQQQQQPGGPQMQPMMGMGQGGQNMMIMRGGPMGGGPSMNGGPHQQPGQPHMGTPMNLGMGQPPQMGVPQMANAMSLNPQMSHPSMAPQMQMHARDQYRPAPMHPAHKGNMPPQGGPMPGNAGSPASSDPTFNLGPLGQGGPGAGVGPPFNPAVGPNRMGQNKMMPPPPPSPSLNGPPKDQNPVGGPNKDHKNPNNPPNGHPEESPRNQQNSGQTPNSGGTAPPTPVPSGLNTSQQNQNPQNQNPGQNMAPSPSSILGGPPVMNPPSMGQPPQGLSSVTDPMSANLFSTDFIQSVASSLDDFDPSLFRPDGDINFERDFGQWFNPDDVGGTLDMK